MASRSAARNTRTTGGALRTSEGAPLREALAQGDYRSARSLAEGVLQNGATSESARAEAQLVFAATEIPREAIVTGAVAAVVILSLFLFVL